MSNTCTCPEPPGGSITCGDDQLAVCGYQDGKIVSGCYSRPASVNLMTSKNEKVLALANWAISQITGTRRTDLDRIDSNLIAMLQIGQYVNEQSSEVIKFALPKDLDVQLLLTTNSALA